MTKRSDALKIANILISNLKWQQYLKRRVKKEKKQKEPDRFYVYYIFALHFWEADTSISQLPEIGKCVFVRINDRTLAKGYRVHSQRTQ